MSNEIQNPIQVPSDGPLSDRVVKRTQRVYLPIVFSVGETVHECGDIDARRQQHRAVLLRCLRFHPNHHSCLPHSWQKPQTEPWKARAEGLNPQIDTDDDA